MKSLRFFQPMQHVPLRKMENVSRLTKPWSEYLVYPKPIGIDVYMVNGKIYDFDHRELINRTLAFEFEKVMESARMMQGLCIGTLCTIVNPTKIFKHRSVLYEDTNLLPMNIRFAVYDIIFPYFSAENPFYVRNDIVAKTIGGLPNCTTLEMLKFKNTDEFRIYLKEHFNVNKHESFILFDKSGSYYAGTRQLTYTPDERVSFELSASQKYRSHVKKITPVDIEISEGNIVKVAGSIETRFKDKTITVPINTTNYIMRKSIWEHRKELKRSPFIFEGIYLEDENAEFEILGIHYSKFIL